jgi:Fe-S-cluster containining protein
LASHMEIDLSELKNKSYGCLDNCAMCCYCQPEISEEELARFRKYGLTPGLTKEHIQGYVTDQPTAIKLQGGNGACHFLKEKRCTIHDKRPAFCRQFPVHVHALHRIQLNANLSCRGITPGGSTLEDFGNGLMSEISTEMKKATLAETMETIAWFEQNAKKNGVYQSPGRMREVVELLMPHIAEPGCVGRLLAFADSEPEIGSMPADKIVELVLACEPPEDLEEIAKQGNYEQFEIENPAWLPVYLDPDFRLNSFRSANGGIELLELHSDGKLEPLRAFPMEELGLLAPTSEALKIFADYAKLLNSRDQFLGSAYHVCAENDFEHDLLTVYLGMLGTALLDLWWRAGFVGKVLGKNVLDAELAAEGVRAFDMDCLDMPTVGVFF